MIMKSRNQRHIEPEGAAGCHGFFGQQRAALCRGLTVIGDNLRKPALRLRASRPCVAQVERSIIAGLCALCLGNGSATTYE